MTQIAVVPPFNVYWWNRAFFESIEQNKEYAKKIRSTYLAIDAEAS